MDPLYLKNIHFTYPGLDKPTLLEAELTLGEGRIGLAGANGSGKTTLLHVAVGLLRPQKGHVAWGEKKLSSEKDFTRLRRRVGFLFQHADDQLFSPTALEDVAFGPLNQGLKPAEAKERALETMADLGLEGLADRSTHRLSGGEKKLVALAGILSMRPDLLLLDEPTNELDPAARERMIERLKGMHTPMAVVSHDWDFLSEVTEKLYMVENGQVVRRSSPVLHVHRHAHPMGDAPHVHECEE